MLLLIDNLDSFTYNIVQAFQVLKIKVEVVTKEAMTLNECLNLNPKYIVIGPGPGSPSGTPLSKQLILACEKKNIPLLGICLGHQALAEVYGGTIKRAETPIHGKTSAIFHQNQGIFKGLPFQFSATRYHSLIVDELTLPSCLEITARTESNEIMGLSHKNGYLHSVQFHPESILTIYGPLILKNFIDKVDFPDY